jgi:hypothetical protein
MKILTQDHTARDSNLLKCRLLRIRNASIRADIDCPSTSIDNDYAPTLRWRASFEFYNLQLDEQIQTSIACDKTQFSIAKCKLASPSVTNNNLD